MMHTWKFSPLLWAAVCVLLLAACAAPQSTPTLPTLAQLTAAPRATNTVSVPTLASTPTQPPLPTDTPAQTATRTATRTATPAPTADLSLAQVKLTNLGWLPNYNFFLTFRFPGPVDAKNFRATLETKEFQCQAVEQHPDLLYCSGHGAVVEQMAWVRLYQAGSDQPGFEQYTWVPYFTVEHK